MAADPTGDEELGRKQPRTGARAKKASKKAGAAIPRRRAGAPKTLAAMFDRALDAPVEIEEGGARRKMTKRDVVIAQLVDKSAGADLQATKVLLDMLHKLERGPAAPAAAPGAEDEVYAQLREKLARLALAQAAEAAAPQAQGDSGLPDPEK